MINGKTIMETLNKFPENDQRKVFADSFAHFSKAIVEGEELYTAHWLGGPDVEFFEEFDIEDDDVDMYDFIYKVIQKIYKKRIYDMFKNKTYDEVKNSLKNLEAIKKQITDRRIYDICYFDGGKKFIKAYNEMLDEFQIAQLASYRQTELEWFEFIQNILEPLLFKKGWLKDLCNCSSLEFLLVEGSIKGLKAICAVYKPEEEFANIEWQCLKQMLPMLIPKDLEEKFGKVTRDYILENAIYSIDI